MIVPSIDVRGGSAVQLVGGKALAVDAGDPRPIAARFARVGEIALIDLDAACGEGDNEALVADLARRYPARVGGGIRDEAKARRLLDAGARQIILGTRATPDLLAKLPRERVTAALDTDRGMVMTHGWRIASGRDLASSMTELAPYVSGFLVTTIEREGRMVGLDLDLARELRARFPDHALTLAGGASSADEIAALDALRIDVQVGMALYTQKLGLTDALVATLTRRSPGPWPTVVADELGRALGLVWSNAESLAAAVATGDGVYWSRRRGLWHKGATSGNTQKLVRIDVDCDRDALRFTVRQTGDGFCHEGTRACFPLDDGFTRLEQTVDRSLRSGDTGSYSKRLLDDPPLLAKKILEEAGELTTAAGSTEVAHEAADLFYFLSMRLRRAGLSTNDLQDALAARSWRVTRREGRS